MREPLIGGRGRLLGLFLPWSFLFLVGFAGLASPDSVDLRAHSLSLPGAPAALISTHMNGDGLLDLAVVVAYTRWDHRTEEEWSEFDGVNGLVAVMTVIPSLVERRELHVFLGVEGKGFQPIAAPLELGREVLSLESGLRGNALVVLTDSGLHEISLTDGGELGFLPGLERRTALSGVGTFFPDLDLLQDLDGDGLEELLLPVVGGLRLYHRSAGRWQYQATLRYSDESRGRTQEILLPEALDLDGDGLPEIVVRRDQAWDAFTLFRNLGEGEFSAPITVGESVVEESLDNENLDIEEDSDSEEESSELSMIYLGDLDGDGRAEFVSAQEHFKPDAGVRESLQEAREPNFTYGVLKMGDDFTPGDSPVRQFDALGYSFTGDDSFQLPGGFQDLDQDGRQDLVLITLDFSVMQAVRIMATRSLSIGMDFRVFCQEKDGSFKRVTGVDLSGKFKLNLNNLALRRLAQFAGDFDGDGIRDFVQMGRGKKVEIHRGRPGCFYPPKADYTLKLKEEPQDLSLVKIRDFDGDGRADVVVTGITDQAKSGNTEPVHLDLYLSGRSSNRGEP